MTIPFTGSPLGDSALLITLGDAISDTVNDRVHQAAELITRAQIPAVQELVPAFATLTVHYDPCQLTYEALWSELERCLVRLSDQSRHSARVIEIPVCYDNVFAPDLAEVAYYCGLTPEDVIRRHCQGEYRVHFLGFSPGFPFLAGMDPDISCPRKKSPRLKIPAGSVGIAGSQTGIYPMETPGGWQLIGRTPLKLINLNNSTPTLLQPGDQMRFKAISRDTFEHWEDT
ncbi:5-oxoprolinase subunit PxpB [Kistimonas asteriae]|uniref:5-oxoprolinase subunit PxpB n=1 Tax=Kistimonas asteriae TaxID=517724 RepID=UPI001BAE1433|nr:5-oxoprolinase subunit PxpB [Kistimonas asteriae]